ncbi:Uncharacterized protein GBIM_02820 [Gryllus bimaculatus]|nr:Uncharacterized protein GBIM_02820 [Gryllus bimaculatus]
MTFAVLLSKRRWDEEEGKGAGATPGRGLRRWRHCSYHCLQLLAARALLFMQLLVLVLQIVATLALEPAHHRALLDQGLPDVLSQLLLPSDEWYYTNHSTKYARFVKHHAGRSLVYLGLQHRVNLRFSVFDILQDEAPPPTPLLESVEDTYIQLTSAPPAIVTCPRTDLPLGLSVEGAVMYASLGQSVTTAELSTLHWVVSGSAYGPSSTLGRQGLPAPPGARRPPPPQLQAPASCPARFVHTFVSCFPAVLSPVVLLRLLLHRLLTTAAPLQRWKSCASRSSFASASAASAHDAPRSPRSRASSTDTEPSSLRRRRKVRSAAATKAMKLRGRAAAGRRRRHTPRRRECSGEAKSGRFCSWRWNQDRPARGSRAGPPPARPPPPGRRPAAAATPPCDVGGATWSAAFVAWRRRRSERRPAAVVLWSGLLSARLRMRHTCLVLYNRLETIEEGVKNTK